MGIKQYFQRLLIKAISKANIQLIPSYQSGRAVYSDWTIENAITSGLKASNWVYACISKKADAVASVPWYVEELKGEEWMRVKNHPLEILLQKANPFMSGQNLFERLIYHLDLGGNGLWYVNLVGQGKELKPYEIYPLHPDKIKPVPDRYGYIQYYEYKIDAGISEKLDPKQVVHFMYPDPASLFWGMSPLQAVARSVDTDNEAVDWNKASLQNRAVTSGVFTTPPDVIVSQEQYDTLKEQIWAQHVGSDNAGAPWIVTGGAQWTQMSLSPQEMDFLESRKFHVSEIAAVFGVPVVLLSAERTTYNNMSTARRLFWEDTIIPLLSSIQEVMNLSLCRWYDPSISDMVAPNTLRINYDLSNVPAMREGLNEKVMVAATLYNMGVPFNTINQRLNLGFDSIPGGDEPKPAFGFMSAEPSEKKGKVLTEEEKTILWKARDHTRRQWESKIDESIKERFKEESKVVVKAFKERGEAAALAAIESQRRDWEVLLKGAYMAVIEFFAERAANRLIGKARGPTEKKFTFDPWAQSVQMWIAAVAGRKITRMLSTTQQTIAKEIGKGMSQELTSLQIAKMIEKQYDSWRGLGDSAMTEYRSLMIARTETGGAANFGNREGAAQTGLKLSKTWISSRDGRVRDEHSFMDGETRPFNEPYSNGLMYPGDPGGSADEVINCRCVETYDLIE